MTSKQSADLRNVLEPVLDALDDLDTRDERSIDELSALLVETERQLSDLKKRAVH